MIHITYFQQESFSLPSWISVCCSLVLFCFPQWSAPLHLSALVLLICVWGKWCACLLSARVQRARGKAIDPCWPYTQPNGCRPDSARQMKHQIHRVDWPIPINNTATWKTPAAEGGGGSTPHETDRISLEDFYWLLMSIPCTRLYPSRVPVRSFVLMLKSRTEHNVFLLLLSLYWTEIIISQNAEVGQMAENNTNSLLPQIKQFWLDFQYEHE